MGNVVGISNEMVYNLVFFITCKAYSFLFMLTILDMTGCLKNVTFYFFVNFSFSHFPL